MIDKRFLLVHCRDLLADKVDELQKNLQELQDSANNNSKSSMGDKYETGRAMVHLEQENIMSRYETLEAQLKVLNGLATKASSTVELGSLVTTDVGSFYLSVGLGKLETNGFTFFAIAATSPIGTAMIGKKIGDSYILNHQSFVIHDIR